MEEEKKEAQFDWKQLGVDEFKGEETVNHLKELIDKGRVYDDVAGYKDKYESLNAYLDIASNPLKYFADGEAGLKREQLRMKYPSITPEIASMISNDGKDLSPIEAMAVSHFLKSGGKSKFSDIIEVLKEENGIEDGEEIDSKTLTRLQIKSAEAYDYIKNINADVKIPDVQQFTDFTEKRRQELEGLNSQLSETWNTVVPDVKQVIKSTPISYTGEYEVDGVKHAYNVPVELSDEDLATVDVMVKDMAKSKTTPTKEVLAAMHEIVVNASIKNKLPQIMQETARQIAESVKNKYTNPELPRATDKPKGSEQVGMSDAETEEIKSFFAKMKG